MLTTDYSPDVAPDIRSNRMSDEERAEARAAQKRVEETTAAADSARTDRDALFWRLKRDRGVGATEIAREVDLHRTVIERIFRELGGRRK